MDEKTVKGYVDVLERLFLVRVRRPWQVNRGKRQVKAPKLYVTDSGLLAALIGLDAPAVNSDDGMIGSLYETFVATELERQASWSPEPLSFWHYRSGDREVDERVGKRLIAGLVLYSGDRTLALGERLWAIPFSALWAAQQWTRS